MNPILYAIPVFLLTIVLEAWLARRRGLAVYDIPDAVTSLHHGVLSQVTGAFTKVASLGIYIAVYDTYRLTEWSMGNAWLWVLALILYDLCYYWAHRMGHEVNLCGPRTWCTTRRSTTTVHRAAPNVDGLSAGLGFLFAAGRCSACRGK